MVIQTTCCIRLVSSIQGITPLYVLKTVLITGNIWYRKSGCKTVEGELKLFFDESERSQRSYDQLTI